MRGTISSEHWQRGNDYGAPDGTRHMKALRILLADDHEVVRQGLRALLQEHEGWEICGEAVDGREAVAKAAQLKPDLVVLDIGMPKLNGLEATRQILHQRPETVILVLTLDESDQAIREALLAGARGFLRKSDAARELVAAVEALQKHRTYFAGETEESIRARHASRDQAPRANVRERLTPREKEVVRLLANGKTNREIASVLAISVKTAETHRANIMRKFNFHSVSQLVLYAIRNNMMALPTESGQ